MADHVLRLYNDAAVKAWYGVDGDGSPFSSPGPQGSINVGGAYVTQVHYNNPVGKAVYWYTNATGLGGIQQTDIFDPTTTAAIESHFTGGASVPTTNYLHKCWANNGTIPVIFKAQNTGSGESTCGKLVMPGQQACVDIVSTNKTGWSLVTYNSSMPGATYHNDENGCLVWDAQYSTDAGAILEGDAGWTTSAPGGTSNSSNTNPGSGVNPVPATTNIVNDATGGALTEGTGKRGFEAVVETLRQGQRGDATMAMAELNKLEELRQAIEDGGEDGTGNALLEAIRTNTLSAASSLAAIYSDQTNYNLTSLNKLGSTTNLLVAVTNLLSGVTNGLAGLTNGGLYANITNWSNATNDLFSGATEREGAMSAGAIAVSSSYTTPDGPGDTWTLSVRGITMDLNPMHHAELSTVASWFRQLLNWTIALGLAYYVVHRLTETVNAMGGWQQASGSHVSVAGFGTNLVTGIAARLIILAALALVPAFYISWKASSGGIFEILGINPFASGVNAIQNGVWLADQFFPLGVMLSDAALGLGFTFGLSVVAYGKQTIVRSVPGS